MQRTYETGHWIICQKTALEMGLFAFGPIPKQDPGPIAYVSSPDYPLYIPEHQQDRWKTGAAQNRWASP